MRGGKLWKVSIQQLEQEYAVSFLTLHVMDSSFISSERRETSYAQFAWDDKLHPLPRYLTNSLLTFTHPSSSAP